MQTREDFLKLRINPRMVDSIVGFSCIGRWKRKTIGNKVVEYGDLTKGDGCVYAGDGNPCLAPTLVAIDGTIARPTFGWAWSRTHE